MILSNKDTILAIGFVANGVAFYSYIFVRKLLPYNLIYKQNMSTGLIIVLACVIVLAILIFLLSRTSMGCMVIKCGPELIACLRDEESRKGLQALMQCSDPNSERIKKQEKELDHLEIPGDANIASARILDEYPAGPLAAFSRNLIKKCSHVNQTNVPVPQKCISFKNEPLAMDISEHKGKWWRTHTDSWDNWDGSYMTFAEGKDGEWELHINYQVETAMRGTVRRTIVENLPADKIEHNQFGTRLIMWDTETTEVWKLLHKTDDARLFVIRASTQIPQPRIDSIVLIVSRTPQLSEKSEMEMKQAVKDRGLVWDHFSVLDCSKYKEDIPVIPFQVSEL